MIKAGLKKLISDHSAFIKNLGSSKIIIVIVNVNNFLIFEPDFSKSNIVKSFLGDQYKMKNLGFYKQFTKIKL